MIFPTITTRAPCVRFDETANSTVSNTRASSIVSPTKPVTSVSIDSAGSVGVNVGSVVREIWVDRGLTRVTGSHLPRHSDSHTCCLTRSVIRV